MSNQAIDVTISGSGKVGSGIYNQVRVSGSARMEGDVDCQSLHVSGSAVSEGNLHAAEEIHISGSLKAQGNVETEGELHVSGSASVEGDLRGGKEIHLSGGGRCQKLIGGEVRISGAVTCQSLTAQHAKLSGGFKVEGDLQADQVKISGAGRIEGLLTADEIQIAVGYRPESVVIGSIGGSRLTIQRGDGGALNLLELVLSLKPLGKGSVVVDTIEADEIDIVSTKAQVVRGQQVKIGEGCEIERVEYSESYAADPSARVGEAVKI